MPRRRGGLFLPLDVNFLEDDRIVEAGERSMVLYLAMCLASKRLGTDGMLTTRQLDRLHIAGWKQRLAPLLDLHLVEDFGSDLWGISAWLNHNDPQVKVAEVREKDRVRKRGGVPSGIRPESVPTPSVERSREKKREVDGRDCEHGIDRHASCPRCPSSLKAVNS